MTLAGRPRVWDARSYDRVSDPQVEMAQPVLERMSLAGNETVLDAGCGSGRVTRLLLERLPAGHVVAVDADPAMVSAARAALADCDRARVLDPVDLQELVLPKPVDSVFSNAVFHHVPDHELLFARLHAVLRPGGRLVAQCGGAGNIAHFHSVAREVSQAAPYARHLGGWEGPWNFATPEATERRLRSAGFERARCWLEPWPVRPREPLEYISTVCLGYHLRALPAGLRRSFARQVASRCGEPLELDYVRLNIDARRG